MNTKILAFAMVFLLVLFFVKKGKETPPKESASKGGGGGSSPANPSFVPPPITDNRNSSGPKTVDNTKGSAGTTLNVRKGPIKPLR